MAPSIDILLMVRHFSDWEKREKQIGGKPPTCLWIFGNASLEQFSIWTKFELHSKSPGERGHNAGSVEANVRTSLEICRSRRIPLLQLLLTRDIGMKPHSYVLSIV